MPLTTSEFLAISYRQVEEVHLPEVNSSIFVRTMSGAERERFEEICTKQTRNIRAWLIVLCACDAQGERLFFDNQVDAVAAKPAPILMRIFDAAMDLNALAKKDVDELEKNSEAIPSEDSNSELLPRCL